MKASSDKNKSLSYRKSAIILTLLLLLLGGGSVGWLALVSLPGVSVSEVQSHFAEIYQNGVCIETINLDTVENPYTFDVRGDNSCINTIEVRPGSIGIVSADCPDKLCVHQGFISNSLLPITCLPNHLVIQIHKADSITPDITSY